MMRVASRRHGAAMLGGVTAAAAAALVALGLWGQWQLHRQRERADHLVDQLLVADLSRVSDVAAQLDGLPGPWRPRLGRIAGDEAHNDAERLPRAIAGRPAIPETGGRSWNPHSHIIAFSPRPPLAIPASRASWSTSFAAGLSRRSGRGRR